MSDAPAIPAAMAAAALEFQADAHADAERLAERAESLQDAPPPVADVAAAAAQAAAAKQTQEAAQAAEQLQAVLLPICTVAVLILDKQAQRFAGESLALSPEERATIAQAAVPVLEKWIPDVLAKLAGTPEGRLALVVGGIYGAKLGIQLLSSQAIPPKAAAVASAAPLAAAPSPGASA